MVKKVGTTQKLKNINANTAAKKVVKGVKAKKINKIKKVKKITKKIKAKTKTPKTPTSKVKIPKLKTVKKIKKIKKVKRTRKRTELICLLTGKKYVVNSVKLKILLTKHRFLDVDELQRNYISREACLLLKQGFTEAEIRQKFNNSTYTTIPFAIIKRYIKEFAYEEKMLRKRKRKLVKDLTSTESVTKLKPAVYEPIRIDLSKADNIQYLTKGSCLRPDIHLNGDHSCNHCPYFNDCVCAAKRWNNKISKLNAKQNKKS